MRSLQRTTIAIAIGLVFSVGVMAQAVTKDAYKVVEASIATQYTSERGKYDALSGNTKDICVAQAKGHEKVATADLEMSYEPTAKHRYQALVAKAKADYAVANEKCDDQAGNDKDVCAKEAKAAETLITADAEAKWKAAEANQTAIDIATAADTKARADGAAARQDATAEKRDANYAVAKEKCDALAAGADSDRCVQKVKTKYGM